MLEKDLLETHNFPPINSFKKPFKKPSIEINQTAIKHYKDLTPLRTRESHNTKIMTITSMPFIGIEDHTFKFTLGQGNNHQIVRKVLNSRPWWTEIASYNTLFNFNWQPTSGSVKFDRLKLSPFKQIVNHFEGQKELSSKLNLLNNLTTYCEDNQKFLFDIIPITFFLDLDHLEKFDSEFYDFLNCFQGKTSLFKSSISNFGPYKLMQKTFDKKNYLYSQPRNYATLNSGNNVWILKPADYNRGRGIRLFNSLEGLQSILLEYDRYEMENYKVSSDKTKTPSSMHFMSLTPKIIKKTSQNREELSKNIFKILGNTKLKTRRFIIQKYIENPLLINQRKFDIRVWVLLNQDMNIFFFREGYIRTSSEIFNLEENGLDNPFIHLTNNAIQKNSEKYGVFEKGNQLSFHHLDKYFRENNLKIRVRKHLLPKMKEIISLCFKSVQAKLNPNKRKYCFEIFGFDFMIDASFALWLLEINTNPCLEESSPLLKQLIPRMLDDAFKLSIDMMFSPKKNNKTNNLNEPSDKRTRVFNVNGFKDNENLWELIGNVSNIEIVKNKHK